MSDDIHRPDHYTIGNIDTIDYIEAKRLDWNLNNVLKYVSRSLYKGEYFKDIRKALWYLNREVTRAEKICKEIKVIEMSEKDLHKRAKAIRDLIEDNNAVQE